ncbi:MAG: DegT/DnrJ/EryC1/StrS family aminotransferase [Bacteriovoracia bacterium]
MPTPTAQRQIGIHDPWITDLEKKEVSEALASNWLSGGGSKVHAFEDLAQEFFQSTERPISTANGSAALLLGLRVAGVQAGDHVLVPSYGFVACANAVRHLGAEPIFIGPENPEMPVVTFEQIKSFFEKEIGPDFRLRKTGARIQGMIYNQPYGLTCPRLSAIAEFFQERKLFLFEDSSQGMGVRLGNSLLGTFGDLSIFSLNGNKTITTGAGGLLLIKNPAWAARARKLLAQSRCDDFDFYYGEAAYNFQMPNVSAAIGVGQFKRIAEILEKKSNIRTHYRTLLRSWKLFAAEMTYPAWHNLALARRAASRAEMRALASATQARGVRIRPAFPAVTENAMYKNSLSYQNEKSPFLFDHGICLPSGPALEKEDIEYVCAVLEEEGRRLDLI